MGEDLAKEIPCSFVLGIGEEIGGRCILRDLSAVHEQNTVGNLTRKSHFVCYDDHRHANIEIYDYIQAYNRLHFSVAGKVVYNPSAIPVWFEYADVTCCVQPGETKTFR